MKRKSKSRPRGCECRRSHDRSAIKWVLSKTKKLKDVTFRDVPPGYSAYDVATDHV